MPKHHLRITVAALAAIGMILGLPEARAEKVGDAQGRLCSQERGKLLRQVDRVSSQPPSSPAKTQWRIQKKKQIDRWFDDCMSQGMSDSFASQGQPGQGRNRLSDQINPARAASRMYPPGQRPAVWPGMIPTPGAIARGVINGLATGQTVFRQNPEALQRPAPMDYQRLIGGNAGAQNGMTGMPQNAGHGGFSVKGLRTNSSGTYGQHRPVGLQGYNSQGRLVAPQGPGR